MTEMIKGRNDWCISRQRTWGVPLPIFYCEECGEPLCYKRIYKEKSKIYLEKKVQMHGGQKK